MIDFDIEDIPLTVYQACANQRCPLWLVYTNQVVPADMRWWTLWLLCLGVGLWCNSSQGMEHDLVRAASASLEGVEVEQVRASRLPASRPQAPKGGWRMCTYTSDDANECGQAPYRIMQLLLPGWYSLCLCLLLEAAWHCRCMATNWQMRSRLGTEPRGSWKLTSCELKVLVDTVV